MCKLTIEISWYLSAEISQYLTYFWDMYNLAFLDVLSQGYLIVISWYISSKISQYLTEVWDMYNLAFPDILSQGYLIVISWCISAEISQYPSGDMYKLAPIVISQVYLPIRFPDRHSWIQLRLWAEHLYSGQFYNAKVQWEGGTENYRIK